MKRLTVVKPARMDIPKAQVAVILDAVAILKCLLLNSLMLDHHVLNFYQTVLEHLDEPTR